MNRRDFFKACGVVTATITVPKFILVAPKIEIPKGLSELALMRELAYQDIRSDGWIVRYDILAPKKGLQLSADFYVTDYPSYLRGQSFAAELMHNEIIHEGLTYADLVPMEPVSGYEMPKDFARLLQQKITT